MQGWLTCTCKAGSQADTMLKPPACVTRLEPGLDHFLLHYATEGWLVAAESRKGGRRPTQDIAAAAPAAAVEVHLLSQQS